MTREYRCGRCHHLLVKGSLKLQLAKQHDPSKQSIEPKSPKCGLVNHFTYDSGETVTKART